MDSKLYLFIILSVADIKSIHQYIDGRRCDEDKPGEDGMRLNTPLDSLSSLDINLHDWYLMQLQHGLPCTQGGTVIVVMYLCTLHEIIVPGAVELVEGVISDEVVACTVNFIWSRISMYECCRNDYNGHEDYSYDRDNAI